MKKHKNQPWLLWWTTGAEMFENGGKGKIC